jgi:hypothetical protein
MKSTTSDALKRLSTLKATISETSTLLHEALTEVRDSIAAGRKELQELQGLPVPPEELADRMRSVLEERRAYLIKEYGSSLVWSIGKPDEKPRWPHLSVDGDRHMVELMLLSVALDEIVASVVGALDYTAGLPLAARGARIEALEAELGELEREKEQLVDEMVARGIEIKHRPAVVERRASESQAAELRKRADEDRQRREELIEKYGDPMALQKGFTARNSSLPAPKPGSALVVRGA